MKCYIREWDHESKGYGPWRRGAAATTGRGMLTFLLDGDGFGHRNLARIEVYLPGAGPIEITGVEPSRLLDSYRMVCLQVSPGESPPAEDEPEDEE